jgi:2-methylcitrate dehydratase PrpD
LVHVTQVQALARYAARATFDQLSPESRKQLPVHILDSLGCRIAALGAAPVEACREQVTDFGGTGPCALIGGGKANPVYAAFWHTALVRYVDFMKKVSAKPNQEYTEQYPRRMPAKITIRLQDGTTFQHEVQDYPGLASHPFTWEDEVEKFDQLVAGRIDDALSKQIKDAVRSLESIQVRDLMALLGRVKTLT